jgi:hypothetical protein
MADPPTPSDTGDDTGVEPDRESTARMPRWVKVSGIIVVLLVLLVIILAITGVLGGQHGPGRHLPGGGGGQTPPAVVTEDHTSPIEHSP